MNPSEYVELTRVLDHDDYSAVRERISTEENARLVHYAVGMATEVGEIQDALKKAIIYGKPLDKVNLKEEIGDVLWYTARMINLLGLTFEECMEVNIKKLKTRFGDKFTEHAALNRNLEKEREILEG